VTSKSREQQLRQSTTV